MCIKSERKQSQHTAQLCQNASRVLLISCASVGPELPFTEVIVQTGRRQPEPRWEQFDDAAESEVWVTFLTPLHRSGGMQCGRGPGCPMLTHHLLTIRAAASMSLRHQMYSGPLLDHLFHFTTQQLTGRWLKSSLMKKSCFWSGRVYPCTRDWVTDSVRPFQANCCNDLWQTLPSAITNEAC